MDDPTREAETFLREELEYNRSHKIWPTVNRTMLYKITTFSRSENNLWTSSP